MSDAPLAEGGKLAVRIPRELLTRVDAAARERGVGRSSFVRQALEAETDSVLGNADGPSLYDVFSAAGVLGRFPGPVDLSTTPKDVIRELIAARHAESDPDRRERTMRRPRARRQGIERRAPTQ